MPRYSIFGINAVKADIISAYRRPLERFALEEIRAVDPVIIAEQSFSEFLPKHECSMA